MQNSSCLTERHILLEALFQVEECDVAASGKGNLLLSIMFRASFHIIQHRLLMLLLGSAVIADLFLHALSANPKHTHVCYFLKMLILLSSLWSYELRLLPTSASNPSDLVIFVEILKKGVESNQVFWFSLLDWFSSSTTAQHGFYPLRTRGPQPLFLFLPMEKVGCIPFKVYGQQNHGLCEHSMGEKKALFFPLCFK